MTTNVDELKIECNDETFTKGTYNGISVIFNFRRWSNYTTFRVDVKINEKPIAQEGAIGQNEYYACPKKGEHEK